MADASLVSREPEIILTLTQEETRYLYEITGRLPYKQGELNASIFDAIDRLISRIQYSDKAVDAADDAFKYIRED